MDNQIVKILLNQIDEPEQAMRSRFDSDLLEDLAQSIKSNGLIQPIVVKKKGDRYEVVAGHRRLQAHRMIEMPTIDAIVKDYTEEQAESAKVHENLFREEVNPVDQAVFLARYIDKTKSSLEDCARMLNRGEAWVQGRLEILQYPDYMIDQVANGKISLGVAKNLAQIANENIRREYTRFASIQGINVRTAHKWAEQASEGTLPENPANLQPGQDYFAQPASTMKVTCAICQLADELSKLESDFVHPACRREMHEQIMGELKAEEYRAEREKETAEATT